MLVSLGNFQRIDAGAAVLVRRIEDDKSVRRSRKVSREPDQVFSRVTMKVEKAESFASFVVLVSQYLERVGLARSAFAHDDAVLGSSGVR